MSKNCLQPPGNPGAPGAGCPCPKNVDCSGVCGGNKIIDCSGDCVDPSLALKYDCDGLCGGNRTDCGCNKTIDCNGDCGGTAKLDCFGICGGTAKLDCAGICDGSTVFDCDGTCGGTNLSCECSHGYDCDGVCGGSNYTSCGQCHHGFYDCSGECGGNKQIDCAGICGGTSSYDCNNTCGGTAKFDCDGACGGDNTSCGCIEGFDCLGICGGSSGYDSFGICDGNNQNPYYSPDDPNYSPIENRSIKPKSKTDWQNDTRIPYLDCGYLTDGCENCNGDVDECCDNIAYNQNETSQILKSEKFCGYTSDGKPAYTDVCGNCFGSEYDISKCSSINNLTYIQNSFNENEVCSGSCGYIFSDTSGGSLLCVEKDVCGQCNGSESNISNCSSPENRPSSPNENPENCDYWLVTWSNKSSEYSAWVKDPYPQDFLYSVDHSNYSCFRPTSIIGPICPPDSFIFYPGGYTPCENIDKIEGNKDSAVVFSDNPFICESEDSCGIYPWGGCKFLDACKTCGGNILYEEECPDYTEEPENEFDKSLCFLSKGFWINERTGDMFSAWFNINDEQNLESNFSSDVMGQNDCYVLLYTLSESETPWTCSPPEDDNSPVYISKKPDCVSDFYKDTIIDGTEPLSFINKDEFQDYSLDNINNPFNEDVLCLKSPTSVNTSNNEYVLSSDFDSSIHSSYGLGVGTYLLSVPNTDPIILSDHNPKSIQIYGNSKLSGPYGSGFYGTVFIKVLENFGTASIKSATNGYLNGKSILKFKNSCSDSCSFKTIEECNPSINVRSLLLDRTCSKTNLPENDYTYASKSCIDPHACNYNSSAKQGSIYFCDYTSCSGCIDPRSCNYDPEAIYSNCTTCNYDCLDEYTCRNVSACNYDPMGKKHDEYLCDYSCYHHTEATIIENGILGTNFISIEKSRLKYFCIGDLVSISPNTKQEEIKSIYNSDENYLYFDTNLNKEHQKDSKVRTIESSELFILQDISTGDNLISLSCYGQISIGDKILINEGKSNQEVLEILVSTSNIGEFIVTNFTQSHSAGDLVRILNPLNIYE